jgi:TonB-linked SusC/RagA family outer membrane protein
MNFRVLSMRVCLTLLVCMLNVTVFAQHAVKGVVKDQSGEAMIGVSVLVQGTSNGTVTDINGNYSISNVPSKATLVVSYVGYLTQKVAVAGRNTVDIVLKEDNTALDEVVVIGYGTVKKRDLTGSVASVSKDALIANPVANVQEALQGKLAGVSVISQDGRPGADVSVRVRGGGSITQSNEPLYVVDGFPVSDISDIPADQIVSVDVLKDASSTAIYGARGANGVILVTTKAADSDHVSVTYSGYYQTAWAAKHMTPMDAQDYVKNTWSYGTALGMGDVVAQYFGLGSAYGNHYDDYANVSRHDYTDDMLRTAGTWNHNVTLSGGSDKTKFTFSTNYINEDGIKVNSGYDRLSMNLKLKQIIVKGLTFDFDGRFSKTSTLGKDYATSTQGSLLSSAYGFRPIDTPLGTDDPNLFGLGSQNLDSTQNPYDITMSIYNRNVHNNLRGNFALTWEPIKGLTLRSELGVGRGWNQERYYDDGSISSPQGFTKGHKYAYITKTETENWRWVTTANYQVQGLGADHSLSIMLGNEELKAKSQYSSMYGAGYPSGSEWTRDRVFGMMNMGDATKYPSENKYENIVATPTTTESFFGRINYGYLDRYLFTFTMRADGSSKFGPNNHWGYFPAGAFAWRIVDEPFMKSTKSWLDNLKLRLSYGTSGADNIASSLWHETWSPSSGVWNGNTVQYYSPSGMKENPDLKWETTISRNIGIDFGIANRLNGTLDFYWNTTKDLLMRQEIDTSSGYSYQYANIGQTSNKGFELSLNYAMVRTKNFNLNMTLTYNYNKNNVDELMNHKDILYGSAWGSSSLFPGNDFILTENQPVGLIRGFKSQGIYTVDDFDYANGVYTLKSGIKDISLGSIFVNYPKPSALKTATGQGAFPGCPKFEDTDGSGLVDLNDATIIGKVQPHHTGGFALSGNYKNFDFNANFTYQIGGKIYNASSMVQLVGGKETLLGRNKLNWIKDCFQLYDVQNGELVAVTDPTALASLNANARYPVPYYESSVVTSEFVEDASYLRLSNLTFGYTLPKQLTMKAKLQRVRFYVTGANLFCITGYSGLDPEVNADPTKNKNYPTIGMDYGTYVRSRSFTFGVNVEF